MTISNYKCAISAALNAFNLLSAGVFYDNPKSQDGLFLGLENRTCIKHDNFHKDTSQNMLNLIKVTYCV